MPQKKEALKTLRTSLLSRGFSLAKASLRPGRMNQIEAIVKELGQLKGSAMKVGQTLSMYGEHLLPKEVTEMLKTLQSNAAPLSWAPIAQVLQEELGAELLAELEVEPEALGAASIGQVHRARVKATGEELVLKVQYPGVSEAIASDLKLLKFFLNMSELVPRGPRFDQIFEEIKEMLAQEIDYTIERRFLDSFYDVLKSDKRYLLPKSFSRYSTRRVLAMEKVCGVRVDSPEVQALSLERRNALGLAYFDLYMRELLELRQVQTDPHLGNYLIRVDESGADQLVLFDFGAVRAVPKPFLKHYYMMMSGGVQRDPRLIEIGGRQFGLLQPEDKIDLVRDFCNLVILILEPFSSGVYDWGASDLPKRVAKQVSHIAFSYKLRAPPRELVFLDRKLGGAFMFLSGLKCVVDARPVLERHLARVKVELGG